MYDPILGKEIVMTQPHRLIVLVAALVAASCWGAVAGPVPTLSRAPGQVTPARVEPLAFCVVFSEPVTGFDESDVVSSIGTTLAVSAAPPHNGTAYTIVASSVVEDGTLCLTIPSGAALGLNGAPSEASESSDSCVTLDRQPPPPPSLLEPGEDAASFDLSPRFAWSEPGDLSGIAKYEIEIRGPKMRDYLTTRTSYTPTLGLEGPYTWRVNALDRAGNAGEWTPWRALVLDASPPSPPAFESSTLPAGAWMRVGTIELAIAPAADSGTGLGGYAVAWNHSPGTAVSGPANRSVAWDAENYAVPSDVEWWCHAVALDKAGNRSTAVHAGPFCIDRTPPVLHGFSGSLRLPNDPGRLFATADWSAVTAVDALDPAPVFSFSTPSGALLPIGSSDVLVTAEDRAGNVLAQHIPVFVYNTDPPVIRVVSPEPRERIPLGAEIVPSWVVTSLAPLRDVRAEGLEGGALDTRRPGLHTLAVTVTDSTGLSGTAGVEYMVVYASLALEIARVSPSGAEGAMDLDALGNTAEGAVPRLRLAEWLRVRCTVDASLARTARAPISFSLIHHDPLRPGAPIVERLGTLADDGATYSLDLPLVVFQPGLYTLWLGFVDATSRGFAFELVR